MRKNVFRCRLGFICGPVFRSELEENLNYSYVMLKNCSKYDEIAELISNAASLSDVAVGSLFSQLLVFTTETRAGMNRTLKNPMHLVQQ